MGQERDDDSDSGPLARLSEWTVLLWVVGLLVVVCGSLAFAGWFVSGLGPGD